MTAEGRAARTRAADELCQEAYRACAAPDTGCALVAVGGYGRGELAPYSDLDLVLVHDDRLAASPEVWAEQLWYPLWDSGSRLDHSVRSFPEMLDTAEDDLRVALGVLDVRHLAGDPNLTLRLRTTLLAQWRRGAKGRLPELRRMVAARHALLGELAHAAVPDLKEAEGGLRDATVLKALVATWLVDVSHVDLERSRVGLLDVRDRLHDVAGRATDRIAPELWTELARASGLTDALSAQGQVRELGRRITHLSRLTWRRVDSVLAPPATGGRRPELTSIAPGVALSAGEVVLDAGARPERDPLLLLRAAAEAAERDLVLAPATAARLAQEAQAPTDPWPREARQLFVRLLASGCGLLGVWETLEETGALDRILPEWERIRLLPHASEIHRFTVDRHVVETCIEASALIRQVARPDVLMVAALLHDIGKGGLTEHSVAGEPLARAVARRMGFEDDAVEAIGTLVRWHLLLVRVATTRDPEDPATVAEISDRIPTVELVSLLLALSEADARATAPQAWSSWRAGLVVRLAERVSAALGEGAGGASRPVPEVQGVSVPPGMVGGPGTVDLRIDTEPGGSRITVVACDRVGLLADVAATLALQRASVRSARAWSSDDVGISVWDVADEHLDPAVVRQRFDAIVAGRIDPGARVRGPWLAELGPTVAVQPEASDSATVLEVRAEDRPGVLYLVLVALADLDITIRSAHVDTLGPQAVDVFYLQEAAAGALSESRAAAAAHAVRAALSASLDYS